MKSDEEIWAGRPERYSLRSLNVLLGVGLACLVVFVLSAYLFRPGWWLPGSEVPQLVFIAAICTVCALLEIKGRRGDDSLRLRRVLFSVSAVFLPFMTMSIYAVISRWPERWFSAISDTGALVDLAAVIVATAMGVICVLLIPVRWYWRVIGSVTHGLVIWSLLSLHALFLVCGLFGDCI